MPSAVKGCMIECDPSIRALILNIDSKNHDIIIEELDDTHLLIDANKLEFLKKKLGDTLDENTFDPHEEEK